MTKPDLTGLTVGGCVTFVDARAVQHQALVTAIWGNPEQTVPCINIVLVASDAAKQDQYGRQLERHTSLVHKTSQGAHGMYYMMPGDTPNPVVEVQN